MITVLLTDDQHLVRAGLRALLENDPELHVIGEASNGQESMAQVETLHPDVVLMDIRMPVMDGIEATQQIKATQPSPAVLILTTFDEDEEVLSAIRAGAAGYLLKDTPGSGLREAVHAAATGQSQLSPQITRKLMDHVASAPPAGNAHDFSVLTDRELQVLKAVAQGLTNTEIAAQLYLSPATARTYVSRILTKLDARDRTELAILAHRAGLDQHP